MSDVSQGEGWWQASDARWYPPEQHPSARSAPVPTVEREASPASLPNLTVELDDAPESPPNPTIERQTIPASVDRGGDVASLDDILLRRGRARAARVDVDGCTSILLGYSKGFGPGDPSLAAIDEQGLAFERVAQVARAADEEFNRLAHLERDLATQQGELDTLVAKERDLRKKAAIVAAVVVALLVLFLLL